MLPSAACPTALRGPRGASCDVVNASLERNTGFPFCTTIGPPPIASETEAQFGCRIRRTVTTAPTGASARRLAAAVPRATRTALPGPKLTRALSIVRVTPAWMSTFGAAGGKGESTTEYVPASDGVVRPQSDEKSEIPFGPGGLLK